MTTAHVTRTDLVRARAALAARASYGTLIARLASRTWNVAAAEDALADALVKALEVWPRDGIPASPEAWLLTVARRRGLDDLRQRRRRRASPFDEELHVLDEDTMQDVLRSAPTGTDPRLGLLFVCAHPAIDANVHTALMLQTVLGFEAQEIARGFLVSPAALSQRLVRAKRKILELRLSFEVPEPSEYGPRLDAVLEAIYGCYSLVWLSASGKSELQGEAVHLAALLAQLMPEEPEALGLAALLAYIDSRSGARQEPEVYVPLDEQDASLWDRTAIEAADRTLRRAQALGRIGRYQIEAAIQAAHSRRVRGVAADARAILMLYEGLVRLWPSAGAHAAHAVAVAKVHGPLAGLAALDRHGATLDGFQGAHAARAQLLAEVGSREQASVEYEKAAALSPDPSIRAWLERKREHLSAPPGPARRSGPRGSGD